MRSNSATTQRSSWEKRERDKAKRARADAKRARRQDRKTGSRTPAQPESRRRLQGTLLTCAIYKKPKDPPEAPSAVTLFTSDSSGDPKGVLRTDENLASGVANLASTLELEAEDRILTTAPLFHAYGFDLGMSIALKLGATLYLEDEVSPARIVKILREQDVNVLPAMPSLYAQLAKVPTAKALKVKHPRFISAGSALSEATAEAFRERWGVRLLSMYHTTEAHAVAADRKGTAPESVGKAVDGVEIRVGEAGKLSPSGTGPVWVRSAAVSRVAIGPMAEDAKRRKKGDVPIGGVDADGWFRTGDLGKLDKAGKLQLQGREDDVVKVDGKRIALGEVEGCIEAFGKVKAAQALVIQDPLAGAMVIARVVVSKKCGAEEIIDHCAKNLASYKVPRRIEFCESLTASG